MDPEGDARWLRDAPETLPVPHGTLRVVDLFAGCGGMSLGLHAAAHRVGLDVSGLALEMSPAIAHVYAKNFPEMHTIAGSVETFFDGLCGDELTSQEDRVAEWVGEVDVLMGGPPCQGHSDLNNHTRRDDPRNLLYMRMARAAEVVRPRVLIIENVPAVVHDTAEVVQETVKLLEKSDYTVAEGVISLVRAGVPQKRRRHLLLASSGAIDPGAVLDALSSLDIGGRTVRWAIEDLVGANASPLDQAARRSADNVMRMRYLFEKDIFDLPNDLRPTCHRDKDHTYNAVYGRLQWDLAAPTITSGFTSMGQGRYVHPSCERTLTPHEAARLQTFPDWFDWSTEKRTLLSTMIGNAVPPLLMARLADLLLPRLYGGAA